MLNNYRGPRVDQVMDRANGKDKNMQQSSRIQELRGSSPSRPILASVHGTTLEIRRGSS